MQITNVITVDNNIRIDNGINGLIDFIAFTTLSSTIGCMKKSRNIYPIAIQKFFLRIFLNLF